MCTLSEGVSYHLGISKNCQQMLCWDLKIRKTWRVLTVHVLRVWSFLQTQDPLYNPKCPFTVLLIEVQSKQYTRLISPKNWLIITTIELKWTHTWEWDPSDQIKAPHVRSFSVAVLIVGPCWASIWLHLIPLPTWPTLL